MGDAEGVIAELKNLHAPDRVRRRGTPAFHAQLLLGCAAINLKRLAKHAPAAHAGVAAAPRALTAILSTGSDQPQPDRRQPLIRLGNKRLVRTTSLCLN
jgi:hypothetical protein